MKVLVSGAGGFLGQHVVERLLARGHGVRAMVRPTSTQPGCWKDVEYFYADLRVHDALKLAFAGIDAVIHVAAATSGSEEAQFASSVVGTERFLNAMSESSVRRLVHISSLVVYDWARARNVMDENTPLLRSPYEMGAYTIAKTWQERVVRRAANAYGWDLTVMRPGFVWGRQHADIAGMGRHFGRIFLMFGPFSRLPLSHVSNCADCIAVALENSAAIGETFNVVDGDDIRVWRYVQEYARGNGQRPVLVPVPYRVGVSLAHLAAFASRRLFGRKGKLPSLLMPRRFQSQFKPIRFSNRKLNERLAWTPPLSFNECLDATYGRSPKTTELH